MGHLWINVVTQCPSALCFPCFLNARCFRSCIRTVRCLPSCSRSDRVTVMGAERLERLKRLHPPVISEHEDIVLWEDVAAVIAVTWHTQSSCDTSPCFYLGASQTQRANLAHRSSEQHIIVSRNQTESDSSGCQLVIHYENMEAYHQKRKKKHTSLSLTTKKIGKEKIWPRLRVFIDLISIRAFIRLQGARTFLHVADAEMCKGGRVCQGKKNPFLLRVQCVREMMGH